MRALVLLLALLVLPQCASGGDEPEAPPTRVIIGIAKSADNRGPVYQMLWRRLDAQGRFTDYDDSRAFQAQTNAAGTVRVRGIPGEFAIVRVEPGAYALDSVFAQLRENNLNYIAQGVIEAPMRPTFQISEGETVYLGIWEVSIDGANAVTRLWRLDEDDARAAARGSDRSLGPVRVRETHPAPVTCRPHAINNLTQRQIC